MPWVRIDDGYADHPKMAAVGPLGQALWLAGLAYCNRNLTDGFIPWAAARQLVPWTYLDGSGPTAIYIGTPTEVFEEGRVTSEYVIAALVSVGLWNDVLGGYTIHDYEDYQPTKAQIMAEREAKVAAGRAGGIAAARARVTAHGAALDLAGALAKSKPVPNPNPVPVSVPNPAPTPSRATLEDEAYGAPEMEALQWLARHGVSLSETNGFRRKLIEIVERFGTNAVVGKFDRLVDAGVLDGDARGFVFGASDALYPKPDLKALEREDRAEDEAARFDRQVERTQREMARIRGETA